MPRRARIAIAGVPWHIIQCGNNRSACFYAEDDYLLYLEQLETQAAKFGCAVHAFCLMTNHVHILLTPQEVDSASLMMKNLGQRYVQYVNRIYRRSGTLWEGRFKSCLAQSDQYVLACYRYIEMNPVRAAMVAARADYRWSSFGFNARGDHSSLLSCHGDYLSLGTSADERRENYCALFDDCLPLETVSSIRKATNANYVLGDSRFQQEIEQALARRVTPGVPGRPPSSSS